MIECQMSFQVIACETIFLIINVITFRIYMVICQAFFKSLFRKWVPFQKECYDSRMVLGLQIASCFNSSHFKDPVLFIMHCALAIIGGYFLDVEK